jgi:hypothetical protein
MILYINDSSFSFIDIEQDSVNGILFAYYYQIWISCCLAHLCELRWFDETGCLDSELL